MSTVVRLKPKYRPPENRDWLARADLVFWTMIHYTKIDPNPALAAEAYRLLAGVLDLYSDESQIEVSEAFAKATAPVKAMNCVRVLKDLEV